MDNYIIDKLRYSYAYACIREQRMRSNDKKLDLSLKNNSKFENLYWGKRCFIFGNGPSLKNVDFSLFRDEYTFTVNQLARNPRFPELHTNFHMWSDERFFIVDPNKPEDLELVESMKRVRTADNNPVVFYKYAGYNFVKQFGLDKDLDIHYFEQGYYYVSEKRDVDFTRFTPAFSTVVHYLICLAVYMGFKEIYLLGCDCTGIVTIIDNYLNKGEDAKYAYQISENEKKRMQRVQQQSKVRDELVANVRLFDDYERLLKYCNARDVKLYNATNPTLLDTIPKVDLMTVLKQ